MFSAFWGVVGVHRSKGPPKPQVFALAVDLVLLNAYDPSWQNEELDRDTLRGACLEWQSRERVL